jgi:putative SOS response-associated peptidase YedK
MCGRFDRHSSLAQFANVIEDLRLDSCDDLPPSFNVAPSHRALVVRNTEEGWVSTALFWGLTPFWAKSPTMKRPINARFETADKLPMFRSAVRTQRCLVLCDGYYEWQMQSNGSKQPYYFHLPEEVPFVLGGIWERNEQLPNAPLETFCILTTAASPIIEHIHHRMPLFLPQSEYAAWLDPTMRDVDTFRRLVESERDDWVVQSVSRFVNNPKNNSSRCRESIETKEAPQQSSIN